ncbi:hypothetical protein DPMN_106602 [Dreissena polymorpha]|uniref:Uncharacterized protein n=1 Tax=Dreissena polymorpha TaxID=45954 RepID=A0A9D4QIZ7_DREPO|nr:hypothetical protein DPMN_106602 [Dreissena polymorpha]
MVTDLREAKMRLYNDDFCSKNINQQSLETHVNTNSTLCSGYTHGQISGCQVCALETTQCCKLLRRT